MAEIPVGAHIWGEAPLAEAELVGADIVQLFLSNPQGWEKPPPRADAAELRAAELGIYVHAPYLINVASPNNRVRIPSRKILSDTMDRAADVGAAGVIVHAGHAEDGIENGFMRWRKVFEENTSDIPILIENTAGGTNAMGRYVEDIARLWEHIGDLGPGFCFDTCHAHAAGEDLTDVVERTLAAVGKIDLVHANSSRDEPGTGADRHANFVVGKLDVGAIVAMVKAAKSPAVICETPWDALSDDVDLLRASL